MSRTVCQAAVDLIKNAEGCRLTAYYCPAHIPTIGYGHTKGVTAQDVEDGKTITQDEADTLLMEDIDTVAGQVSNCVTVDVNDNQFGALVSFTYNLGIGSLSSSTLLKLLNNGDYAGAADQFCQWDKATVGGVREVLPGLLTRREAEQALFLQAPDSDN